MKDFLKIAVWVVIIGGIGVWWFSVKHNTVKNEKAQEAKSEYEQEEKQKTITQFSNKYNAVSDWSELLSKKSATSPILTMEIEDALLRKDNRPILLRVTLDDVERKENKYLAYFSADFSVDFTSLKFILDCNDEQIKKITQRQLRLSDEYAVIAEIQKIRKITFESAVEDKDGEESGTYIMDTLIATGKCLDLLFSGPFVGSYDYLDLYPKDEENK